jgi:F-type H+-transporting ATPase subunit gamma
MPSLKSIRTRIASVKSTQKITRAMKLVAAARLRRAQDAIIGARPYANALLEAIVEVALRAGGEAHPLLDQRPRERIGLVVLTSDRGLAGGFNANLFRNVQRFVNEEKAAARDAKLSLYVVGKKGRDFFRRRKTIVIAHELPGAGGSVAEARAQEIALQVLGDFEAGKVDAVYLVYNEFKSAIQQRVSIAPLLPLVGGGLASSSSVPSSPSAVSASSTSAPPTPASPAASSPASAASGGQIDFLYEPDRRQLLDTLLPQYVESQIYRALLESIASEFGARMTAMDSATNNAKDVIARLTLQYNRARQAAITKELMEIVSGAEALKG